MKAHVVDTNVPIVANLQTEHASPGCVISCIDALQNLISEDLIVIDDRFRILEEYRRYLSGSGQPGVGDAFFKWVWDNLANELRCERVAITPVADNTNDFEEFPKEEALKGFDPNDRKFVAVALSSKKSPSILNAVDSDWWINRYVLERNGVKIEFLCQKQFG